MKEKEMLTRIDSIIETAKFKHEEDKDVIRILVSRYKEEQKLKEFYAKT